jgi:MOSC domain-containing protein YiiM
VPSALSLFRSWSPRFRQNRNSPPRIQSRNENRLPKPRPPPRCRLARPNRNHRHLQISCPGPSNRTQTRSRRHDRQADLTVHGGEYKAVYVYPVEHYAYWKKKLPGRDLLPGIFGENFTTEGLLETEVHIGDRFAIGSAEFTVTQPRLPCYKLGIRFEADDMVRKFLASRRTGFYFAVTKEGQVAANNEIKPLAGDSTGITIAAFLELYLAKQWTSADTLSVHKLFDLPSLPNDWKSYFDHRLRAANP